MDLFLQRIKISRLDVPLSWTSPSSRCEPQLPISITQLERKIQHRIKCAILICADRCLDVSLLSPFLLMKRLLELISSDPFIRFSFIVSNGSEMKRRKELSSVFTRAEWRGHSAKLWCEDRKPCYLCPELIRLSTRNSIKRRPQDRLKKFPAMSTHWIQRTEPAFRFRHF